QTRLGKAAKLGERVEMAANERLGRGPGDKLYVHGPGPAEHHHKGPYPPLLAVSRAVRKRAPVHLGLLTRGGFEPHSGLAGRHPPAERPDEVLEDGVSTGVPLLPDFAQKDDAVVYSLTQTVHDILLVGVQLGRAPGTGLPGQGAVRIWVCRSHARDERPRHETQVGMVDAFAACLNLLDGHLSDTSLLCPPNRVKLRATLVAPVLGTLTGCATAANFVPATGQPGIRTGWTRTMTGWRVRCFRNLPPSISLDDNIRHDNGDV